MQLVNNEPNLIRTDPYIFTIEGSGEDNTLSKEISVILFDSW